MSPSSLLQDLIAEVDLLTEKDIHPKVAGLVSVFVNYLKEPRYQSPLVLGELKDLFDAFYEDLNSLVFYIYTQLKSNKRLLLQKSQVFNLDPRTFDYLSAIANYSSSSVKLSKRCDPEALFQLRVFGFYKFLMIMKTIELAQSKLYSFTHSSDSATLYEKILRFDLRDMEIQALLSEKIHILRQLNLPVQCFLESDSQAESSALEIALLSLEKEDSPDLLDLKTACIRLAEARTPASKLDQIVAIQKMITRLCAFCDGVDFSKMSNDVLLPVFIHVLVNHSPLKVGDDGFDLYLHFMFVKNFLNPLDFQSINASRFTLTSSLFGYDPKDKRTPALKSHQSKTLAELLNLDESLSESLDGAEISREVPEFASDQALLNYIQNEYLNQGEAQFCLTNCEAILYYLMNTPIVEIAPQSTVIIPSEVLEKELLKHSLHDIVHTREELTDLLEAKDLDKLLEEELDSTTRSRSSSLFNTISSAVAQSVSRSRSNSYVNKSDQLTDRGLLPIVTDFEASLKHHLGTNEPYGLSRVRGIFDRIGLASHIQPRSSDVDSDDLQDAGEGPARRLKHTRGKRSHSLFEKLSPNVNRTRSESFENLRNGQTASLRRTTLSSKFSTGMTELMTKISTAANSAGVTSVTMANSESHAQLAHHSLTSVHSIEDPFEGAAFGGRETLGPRSSSLQTMERWFCNIPENPMVDASAGHRSNTSISSNRFNTLGSNYNEGSMFSASFSELTKYHFTDFDSMTISDLKNLKLYYDQLCSEILSGKSALKTSNEDLPEDSKETMRSSFSLGG